MLIYVVAFILNGVPYFIYGPGRDALSNTLEYDEVFEPDDDISLSINKFDDMCYANSEFLNFTWQLSHIFLYF